MVEILFLFIQLVFALYLLYFCISFITGAPFVPTQTHAAGAMIKLAHLTPGTRVYDLGSGDGKLVLLSQKQGANAIGYEINPLLVLLSNLRGAPTQWRNFWHADIADADVIFIYLLPAKMVRLETKLKKECKKGTLVVSNSFIFPKWDILRQDRHNHVYVFRIS